MLAKMGPLCVAYLLSHLLNGLFDVGEGVAYQKDMCLWVEERSNVLIVFRDSGFVQC